MHWILPFVTCKTVKRVKIELKNYDHKRKKMMSMNHFKKAYDMLIMKYLSVH